ncbi:MULTISPECIES: peptidylprolyl isomerase [unclassified Clostridium]|uniref:peptidylprolyl isomerase n=1 Tax=unclassified Clostridium TaxID=2614128 RepID=UPI0018971388|nr:MULTISPECIES: peptidylprolyl isomerase [unclassified Clostridium]MBP3917326.1 peptidylprolyl isomerase [Clostridium sp.]MEE0932344.1 peptidylprolyl isomerase [Clostridium sp.]
MKKVIKKGVILVGISAMLIGLIGCTNNKTSNPNNDEESEVSVESTEELPIATIKVKNFGTIKAELYPDKAPNTVNNFISLANSGFYDGLIFHRVIKGFMNQGGDPNGIGTGGPGYSIKGEFSSNGYTKNDLKHTAGVLSMARASNPDSAGSQFFIMAEDASYLDGDYAAFGKVTEGMDVVEAINSVETDRNDKPLKDVVIESITVDTKGVDYKEPEKIE